MVHLISFSKKIVEISKMCVLTNDKSLSGGTLKNILMARRLIITADDFGYSSGRNAAIVECYKRGAITRTSLLVNAVKTEEAVRLAKQHGIPMGLHLNLSEGYPLLEPSELPTIVDKESKVMLSTFVLHGFGNAVKAGTVCNEQVKLEIQAQVEKYKMLTGEFPHYIDGHQHVHILPGICDVFASSGVTETRLPWEPNISSCDWLTPAMKKFCVSLTGHCANAKDIFSKHSITVPRFTGLTTMGKNMSMERLTKQILNVFQSIEKQQHDSASKSLMICELMAHPGYSTKVTESQLSEESEFCSLGGCGTGPDEFDQSPDREYEMKIICSNEFKNWLKKENIVLQ